MLPYLFIPTADQERLQVVASYRVVDTNPDALGKEVIRLRVKHCGIPVGQRAPRCGRPSPFSTSH